MGTLTWGRGLTLTLLLTALAPLSAQARSWSYTYHPDANGAPGQLASADGPRTDVADITHYQYDAQGNLTHIANPLGHFTFIAQHDAAGRPLVIVQANHPEAVVTALTYDARGRLSTRTSVATGASTHFTYDGVGNLTVLTRPNGSQLYFLYDDARRLVAVGDRTGNRVDYVLDAAGNRTEERISDASGALRFARAQVFDELSRLREIVGLQGRPQLDYDPNGNLIGETDGEGHATAHAFDGLNRLVRTTNALSNTTVYSYDAQDNLTRVQDPNGNATVYTYDGLGNLITQHSPDTGTTTYTYDEAGNRTSQVDARGQLIRYRYDALNRLIAVEVPADPAQNITYHYDETSAAYGLGRLTRVVDGAGVTTYSYTPRGMLATQARVMGGRSFVLRYEYDAADELIALIYPSGRRISYARDVQGRVSQVDSHHQSSSLTLAKDISRLPFGPVERLRYGNGLQLLRSFDAHYRLTGYSLDNRLGRLYSFNGNDDITQIREHTGAVQSYQYDPLRRLIDSRGTYPAESWGYDANGNRLRAEREGQREDYAYEAGSNRLKGISGARTVADTLDANGNLIDREGATGEYDAFNRAVSFSAGGHLIARYAYNAFHQRVKKTVNGLTTYYVYGQDGLLLAEIDGASGQTRMEYVYLDGQPLAMIHTPAAGASASYYIHHDHLGTPQMLTDQAGDIAWAAIYYPFGLAWVHTEQVVMNLRFPGQYFDAESGLHYNWHRYYDPQTGRYITSDPIGLSGGLNTYAYAASNPLMFTDPTGQLTAFVLRSAVAAGGVLWTGYEGYNAGREYKELYCSTELKFNERSKTQDRPGQDMARTAEAFSNFMATGGAAYIPKLIGGIALAGAGGNAKVPFGAAALGIVAFTYGKDSCTCDQQ